MAESEDRITEVPTSSSGRRVGKRKGSIGGIMAVMRNVMRIVRRSRSTTVGKSIPLTRPTEPLRGRKKKESADA